MTRVVLAIAVAGLFTGACEKKEGLLDPVAITITVTPNPQTLQVGATQQFTAVGRDFAGATVGITPVWSVVSGGGTISATGLFTAGTTLGTFASTVKATSGDVSGFATVTVTAAPLATITVTPNPATLAIGGAQQFTAVGRDVNGNVVAITPVWSVVNGGGAINASTGAFTAGNVAGTFANTVRATSGAISGTATVIVTPGPAATLVVTPNPVTLEGGATQQFTAVARDAGGNVVTVTPTWSVVNNGGTIGAGTGLFTAGNVAGTFANTVRATVGTLSATATVTVTAPPPPPVGPLASITVTPNPETLETHASAQFTAVGRDANGNIVPIVPTWAVVNGGGAIGASSGQFAAGANAGTFTNTVRASSGAIQGFATVIVTPSTALARIIVTPNPATLGVGANQQFTAVGQDIAGNPVAITPVWTVVNGGGTINATGRFTAGTLAGTFANTVRATDGTISGNATVIVTPGPLATITVTPNPGTMGPGAATTFTATGRDANGNLVAITPVWSVVNGGGTVNPTTGVFTAGTLAGTYTNTVRATSGTISGNATAIVTPGPLATITVTPNPGIMGTGVSTAFTAVGRDANGNIVAIVPTWSVVNGGGTINAGSGLFTAGLVAGTFNNTVRATSGIIFGSATVQVTAPAPAPIIPLGRAAPNGIMAGTAVTCVTLGQVNADVSISPGNTITGFGPCVITGVQNLGNAVAADAQLDLTTAYNTGMGLPCPPANAIVADLGGTVKAAGVYCTASGIGVTGALTLDGGGDPNATFVFQAGTSLTTAGDVLLINGAQAKNVFWIVGSSATIGTASQWQGNIIALTSITLVDNANLIRGRALARNGAVTLGTNNTITLPLP